MRKLILYLLSEIKKLLIVFLILCSIFLSEDLISQNNRWERYFVRATYEQADNAVEIRFQFIYYLFGRSGQSAYLEYCDFYYSTDGVNYNYLMRSETNEQTFQDWSWVVMKNKLAGTHLEFDGCYAPASGTKWADHTTNRVEVYNNLTNWAYLNIKWFLGSTYKNVQFIRIIGKWHVHGTASDRYLDEVYVIKPAPGAYRNDYPTSAFKSEMDSTVFKNNLVQICKESDAVVLKGAKLGENVHVYSTSGSRIKSIVTNKDVIKIKLPANQIYIIHIGQTRYKVVL